MRKEDYRLIREAYGDRHNPPDNPGPLSSDVYAAMDKQVDRDEIVYKYCGDMEEDELRLHHSILEELLEMDELSRREAQGQGPQRD